MKTNPKLAKHRLVDVLLAVRSERPQPLLLRSVSRRCLLSILRESPDKDAELIQLILTEAENDGDDETVNFCQQFIKDA